MLIFKESIDRLKFTWVFKVLKAYLGLSVNSPTVEIVTLYYRNQDKLCWFRPLGLLQTLPLQELCNDKKHWRHKNINQTNLVDSGLYM